MTNNRTINLTVGWAFILLGVAGIFLPVLQGLLFFIVGLLFLSKEHHWAHQLLSWFKIFINKHFPKTGKTFDNAEEFLNKEIQRMETEKGYFLKKIWVIIAIMLGLGLLGWLLSLLFGWLKILVFG